MSGAGPCAEGRGSCGEFLFGIECELVEQARNRFFGTGLPLFGLGEDEFHGWIAEFGETYFNSLRHCLLKR